MSGLNYNFWGKLVWSLGMLSVICIVLFVFEDSAQARDVNIKPLIVYNLVSDVQYSADISYAFEEKKQGYDLISDDSIQRYLSVDNPFDVYDYKPLDLISIDSNFTANDSKRFFLRKEAAEKFADMAWHFWNQNDGARLYITSAYRSPGFQEYLIRQGCSVLRCARVGTSEHQAGLAIDLKVVKNGRSYTLQSGSVYYNWLFENAKDWGFHNTYQKGVEVDGQMAEGWHWRYLGEDLATELSFNGLTFAEYFNSLNNM